MRIWIFDLKMGREGGAFLKKSSAKNFFDFGLSVLHARRSKFKEVFGAPFFKKARSC
jgi:hypothetical protein